MAARRRQRRDPNSRTVVRIPEQPLEERLLMLAAPVLARLNDDDSHDAIRSAVALAIDFWNAKAMASQLWCAPKPKPLNELTRKMTGKKAPPEDVEVFELLTARWRDLDAYIDPRRVGQWSLEVDDGQPAPLRLTCEVELPPGVEAEVPPPLEERVCIGGKFLDEVRVRLSDHSLVGFPLEAHRGQVAQDRSVTVRTNALTVLGLFAQGALHPVGAGRVDVIVGGETYSAMVLSDVRCADIWSHHHEAILVFRPAIDGD